MTLPTVRFLPEAVEDLLGTQRCHHPTTSSPRSRPYRSG